MQGNLPRRLRSTYRVYPNGRKPSPMYAVAMAPNKHTEQSERKSIVVLTVAGRMGFLFQYTFKLAGGEIGIVIPQIGEQNLLSS